MVNTRIKVIKVIQKEDLTQAMKTKVVTKTEAILTEVTQTGEGFSKEADTNINMLMSLISLCWYYRGT